jgi:N-methylhydantoinase B/oxoprolinase/acetone carboxylase alpha subunit
MSRRISTRKASKGTTSSSWTALRRDHAALKRQVPARNPRSVNDLKAQIAANEKGVRELQKMIADFGLPVVRAYMGHVQDNAAESVRRVLDRLHDSAFSTK